MSRGAAPIEHLDTRLVELAGERPPIALVDTGGDGPALVCIPGYTGSKEDFGPVLAPLAATGLRVVAIDLPGQYESGRTEDAADYAMPALAGAVTALLDALGLERPHLLGHSFGGLVTRAVVLAEPARCASLVLLDSGPAALPGKRAALMTALRPLLVDRGVAGVEELADQAGEVRSDFERLRLHRHGDAALLGMGDTLLAEPDRTPELAAVLRAHAIPALVACGVDDDAWPPALQEQLAEDLGATFAALGGAAHSPAIENPTALVALLDAFYGRSTPAGGASAEAATS